jgi:hypothetical protein
MYARELLVPELVCDFLLIRNSSLFFLLTCKPLSKDDFLTPDPSQNQTEKTDPDQHQNGLDSKQNSTNTVLLLRSECCRKYRYFIIFYKKKFILRRFGF